MHVETYKGYEIKIEQDEDSQNPRTEFDNLGKMICFHGRYSLGDKNDYNHKDYPGWDKLEAAIIEGEKAVISLPIYMYDHGGLTINTTGFSCPWDSGQIGFIVAPAAAVREEYKVKRIITKAVIEKVKKVLLGEVETYDQYLRGDVYGYTVKDPNGEIVDSCWGFFGNWDDKEYGPLTEARGTVDHYVLCNKLKKGKKHAS